MKKLNTCYLLMILGMIAVFLFSPSWAVEPIKAVQPSPTPHVKKKYKVKKTTPKTGATGSLSVQEKNPTKKPSSLEVWLSKMKKKIAGTETKHNKLIAVASVRGDETSDVPPLYWKGKSAEGPVTQPELKEFDEAINSALNGDSAIAKSKLESFVSAYPNSPLKDDAQETIKVLTSANPAP